MEEKYQLKEGCLTIQMPKELDHHEAGRLKMEADFLIGAYHVTVSYTHLTLPTIA